MIDKESFFSAEPPRPLTVFEVNKLFNVVLEEHCPRVVFEAEIARIDRPGSGHLYFSLKDHSGSTDAELSAVMWKNVAYDADKTLGPGDAVVCVGKPNIYAKSGRLQVVLFSVRRSGEGVLLKRFEALKAKLEREGLFDEGRKRKIPFLPKAIGVVTSRTGAVLHDIMVKLQERMPQVPVYLCDARVQGEGAAEEIVTALHRLNTETEVDVIIVARGGGSLQDLWPFNEEVVVRAVFGSRVPVISGVGHEVDVTLCDLAADIRAPTPTAAAEMAVPRRSDLLMHLERCERVLKAFDRWFVPYAQRVDDLELRLKRQTVTSFREAALKLQGLEGKLASIAPKRRLETLKERVAGYEGRLKQQFLQFLLERRNALSLLTPRLTESLPRSLERKGDYLSRIEGRMEALNPLRVLDRGYAIVTRGDDVMRSSEEGAPGEEVVLRFKDGTRTGTLQ